MEVCIVPSLEYPPLHWHWVGVESSRLLSAADVTMALETKVTLIGDRNETLSSRISLNLKITFDDHLTKGKFVEILKQIGNLQLFNQFYDPQRIRLKTEGPQAARASS